MQVGLLCVGTKHASNCCYCYKIWSDSQQPVEGLLAVQIPFFSNIKNITQEIFDESIDSLEDDQIDKVTHVLNEIKYPIQKRSRKDTLDILKRRVPVEETIQAVEKLLFLLMVFFEVSGDYDDFSEKVERAIAETKPEKRKAVLNKFVNSLEYLPKYYEHERLELYKKKANRYYLDMEYSCDMRARFSKDYVYGKTPFEDYVPEFEDLVPIISLYFRVSDGEDRSTCIFQVSEEGLDEIIANLYVAQKEIKLLKDRFGK